MDESRLTIELVPQSCWYTNVRSNVSADVWDVLRHDCYRKAGNACEVCGATRCRLDAHEVFAYDEDSQWQTLVRLICLCQSCHDCKHWGLTELRGKSAMAKVHIMRINGWSTQQFEAHLTESIEIFNRRSCMVWELDISVLEPIIVNDTLSYL